MDTDRRPAQSAISHWRAALLASSALARVGLAVATVSGTLAVLAIAGSAPGIAAGISLATGGAGGANGGGAGGAAGADGDDGAFAGPFFGAGGSAGTPGSSAGVDGGFGVGVDGGGGGGGGGYSPAFSGDITTTSQGGNGGNGGDIGGGGDGGGGGGGANGATVSSSAAVTVSATVTGGTGGGGGSGNSGGGGGGGGAGIDMQTGNGLIVNAAVTGGAGGLGGGGSGGDGGGGAGVILEQGGNAVINATVRGGSSGSIFTGNGGSGGSGVVGLAHPVDITISATGNVTGGDSFGGPGGGGFGGLGGGAGLSLLSGGTVTNAGVIAGGANSLRIGGISGGGVGGTGAGGALGGDPVGALVPRGGDGIAGANLTVINSGTIMGGNGNGVQANAITFTGGSNVLELQAGSLISGNVAGTGTDVFRLGGSTNANFDVSGIGTAAQYRGFNAFEKTGTSTWTLTGSTTAVTPWTLKQGTLSISSDANLGAASGALTLDGGTLQITGGAFLASTRAITLNAGGGTFDIGGGVTGITQSLGGSGPVTFTNGIVSLAAANVYSGATTITSSGTLGVFAAGALSPNSDFTVNGILLLNGFDNTIKSLSGSGDVANGLAAAAAATLTIAPSSGVTTFSGTIADGTAALPLSLIKTGAGTQVLSGTNTYTGGTTIAGGKLAVTDDSNLGATSGGLTFNGGTLQTSTPVGVPNFVSSRAVNLLAGGGTIETLRLTFLDGNIAGAGGLTKAGILPLVLGGTNTYLGPTNVNEGTLSPGSTAGFSASSAFTVAAGANIELRGIDASIGSLAGAGAVGNSNVIAAALTTGSDNTSTTFSGTMSNTSGPLSLIKVGAGTQVLSGTNTYAGATTVNGGTLSVNGSIASSSLTTVNPGGTLGGNGTVGNTTINGGTLSPGNSIGALTVAGNLVLTAASTYMVEVSPAGSDFTHVTGTATLGGATVAAQFAPGSYVEKRYTILTADGGVNGAFAGPVNTNLPQNFKSALAADGNNAYLDLKLDFVVPSGLNLNQTNVATALVNSFNSNGGIPLAFGALDPRGLSQASGEIGTTASQAAFDAQSQFLNTLTGPFMTGGQGAAGSSATSQAMGYAGERKPHDAFASLATKAPPLQTFEQRWRIFGAAYGGNTQIGGNAALGSHDATSRIYGGIGGASYALSPATELGFALGGGGTSFGLSDGLGSGRSEMFQAGVFAHHGFAQGGYLSGAFAYGWHDVNTDRMAPTGERLRGAYKASVLSGRLEAGWRIDTAWAGVTPYAAAQSISYRMPSYLEQGNGAIDSFALGYAGRDVTATRSELGLRLDRTTVMGETLLTLRGRAAWAHNFDTLRNAAATFQALPGSGFLVNGAAMAPDAALVSAGAEIAWRNGLALAATFEGEFSNNVTSYTGRGTLKYAW